MRLTPPLERMRSQTMWSSALVRLGRFEARPEEPLFREVSPPHHHAVVFPQTALRIRYARYGWLVVDPSTVTFYNPDEEYRRDPIDPQGDRCTWISAAPELLEELCCPPRGSSLFTRPMVRSSTRIFAAQRLLLHEIEHGSSADLEVEERILWLLAQLLRGNNSAEGDGRIAASSGSPSRAVSRALEFLAANFTQSHSLAEIARQAQCSAFHLCRSFKAETSLTMHRYRSILRLRHGFDALLDGAADLSRLAFDLGFSSHSHFSSSFRSEFGTAPRAVRLLQRCDENLN